MHAMENHVIVLVLVLAHAKGFCIPRIGMITEDTGSYRFMLMADHCVLSSYVLLHSAARTR